MHRDLLVLLGATGFHGNMRNYMRQLQSAGIESRIIELKSFDIADSLGHQIQYFRKHATEYHDWEYIIFSDAFDVNFYGMKQSVIDKIPQDAILMAAERNCYPDASIAKKIKGQTIWRFANGGLFAGKPKMFLRFCDLVESHRMYHPELCNQSFYNQLLMAGDAPSDTLQIDSYTNLFYCLFHEKDELQFQQGLPHNTVLDTHPNFIHANGKWPYVEIQMRYEESIGQAESVELVPVTFPLSSQVTIKVCPQCRDRITTLVNAEMGIKRVDLP